MKHIKRLALLALPVLLSGCSGNIVATVSQVCATWDPVTVSRADKLTERTAADIAAANASNKTWCPEKKPAREAAPKVASASR